jgi:hypothetical protein
MSQVVIENPIINTPFHEPTRHFRFNDEGITNEIVEGRRIRYLFCAYRLHHKKDKAAKVATARTLWIPAINNHGGFGRWAFIEINDPWNAQNANRDSLNKESTP